jgi:hypothetical protein
MDTTRRRRFRLSLRVLLLLIAVVGVGLGWLVNKIYYQRKAVALIEANSGRVEYDWSTVEIGTSEPRMSEPPGPRWLRRRIGNELFQEIESVVLDNDEPPRDHAPSDFVLKWTARGAPRIRYLSVSRYGLSEGAYRAIGMLKSLEILELLGEDPTDGQILYLTTNLTGLKSLVIFRGDRLTDRALESLSHLPRLQYLMIREMKLTDRGLEYLSRLNTLKRLELHAEHSDVSAVGLQRLRAIPWLEMLSLRVGNWNIEACGRANREPSPVEGIDTAVAASVGR